MVNARKGKTKKRTIKAKMPVKLIRQVASRVVERKAEKKEILAGFASQIAGNNSASTTLTPDSRIQRLDPNFGTLAIRQGTAQDERVGNKVKLVSGKLTLGIWPRPDSAGNTQNLQILRVLILYDKRNPTTTPTPFANLDFFNQSSTTGSTGFTGQMYDMINEINQDRYNILYDKTFKLGQSQLMAVGGSGDPLYNFQANNDFKAFHKVVIPLTKKCVKNLVYKDDQANPQWRGAWLFCYGVAGSSVANTADILVANMYGQIKWKFVDI